MPSPSFGSQAAKVASTAADHDHQAATHSPSRRHAVPCGLDKQVGSRHGQPGITGTHRQRRRHGPNPQVRSKTNRKLAGVCGGLAQYFNLDATLIRVLFVLLAVLGGSGLVLYLAMWIIVPNEP
jgi:phage shock protein C